MILCPDEIKINPFGLNSNPRVRRKRGPTHHMRITIPTVKYGVSGGILLWAVFNDNV